MEAKMPRPSARALGQRSASDSARGFRSGYARPRPLKLVVQLIDLDLAVREDTPVDSEVAPVTPGGEASQSFGDTLGEVE